MIHTGLVSITFRKFSPAEIIDLVVQSGLEGIEWGGDVHIPHGDLQRATEVYRMTVKAGLRVVSYGSYYCVGHDEPVPFDTVLETAIKLKAPTIRVWAGKQRSADADVEYRSHVVQESRRIADMAKAAGITISYEFHGGTLTDTNVSALKLLKVVSHNNIKTYWQPIGGATFEYCLEGLKGIVPWLSNIHVFQWKANYGRQLLAEGRDIWKHYLKVAAGSGRDHFALIEFVKDGAPEVFLQDAKTLKEWFGRV